MSLFGQSDEIITDDGSQYTEQLFRKFLANWGIKHITSSPHYPKSHGFIERHIRHIKSIIKKTNNNTTQRRCTSGSDADASDTH